MKESRDSCSFLARFLGMVKILIVVSDVFISDDLMIHKTSWKNNLFFWKIFYNHSFAYLFVFFALTSHKKQEQSR